MSLLPHIERSWVHTGPVAGYPDCLCCFLPNPTQFACHSVFILAPWPVILTAFAASFQILPNSLVILCSYWPRCRLSWLPVLLPSKSYPIRMSSCRSAPYNKGEKTSLNEWITSRVHTVIPLYIGYKGVAVPLQAWSGPEGSRKLRFPDFMTTAQDSGKVVGLTHQPPLPPGNTPGTHFC